MPSSKYQPTDPDIIKIIHDLQSRVSKLERTPQTSNAGVDSTGITVRSGSVTARLDDFGAQGLHTMGAGISVSGETGILLGSSRSEVVTGDYFDGVGNPVSGAPSWQVVNIEGSVTDPDFRQPTFQFFDKSGDPLIGDSGNARRGFSDPVLAISWTDLTFASTTSGTMADLIVFEWYQYHAHCRVRFVSQNDASTTGTVQLVEDATGNIVASITTPANTAQYNDLIVKRSSLADGNQPNGNPHVLTLQHARASGAGTVRNRVVSVVGIDLSWFQDF